jgi:hypothetical protein
MTDVANNKDGADYIKTIVRYCNVREMWIGTGLYGVHGARVTVLSKFQGERMIDRSERKERIKRRVTTLLGKKKKRGKTTSRLRWQRLPPQHQQGRTGRRRTRWRTYTF